MSSSTSSLPAAAAGGAGSSTDGETAPARSILITSSGPTCEHQGSRLGEYLLHETYNGSVSYRQRHTVDSGSCQYLYRLSDGTWTISPTLGGSRYCSLHNPANSPTLPLSGWRCDVGGVDEWEDDPSLTISPNVSPPACTAVTISAGLEVTTAVPDYPTKL